MEPTRIEDNLTVCDGKQHRRFRLIFSVLDDARRFVNKELAGADKESATLPSYTCLRWWDNFDDGEEEAFVETEWKTPRTMTELKEKLSLFFGSRVEIQRSKFRKRKVVGQGEFSASSISERLVEKDGHEDSASSNSKPKPNFTKSELDQDVALLHIWKQELFYGRSPIDTIHKNAGQLGKIDLFIQNLDILQKISLLSSRNRYLNEIFYPACSDRIRKSEITVMQLLDEYKDDQIIFPFLINKLQDGNL